MSISYISTEGTRDEQAVKEAEEFDFNYAYVFGSQARYKTDNCNGLYGTVIASYNIEYGGEVANVVYVSPDRPLYVIPARFFRLSRELQRFFTTNNQRRKRQENFALMDCVELGHDENHKVIWVAKASRHNSRLDLFSDGYIGIDSIGVLQAEVTDENGETVQERRMWTEKLGYFNGIPEAALHETLPDVAYQVRFRLITQPNVRDEEELQPETLQMATFDPGFQFEFFDFIAVDDVHQDIVETMEWNAPRMENPRIEDQQNGDEQMAFGLESDKPKAERSKAIKDVLCVTISDTELYAPRFANDRTVVVRVPWMNYWELAPGTYVDVSLVYNKWNNWYIVHDYSRGEPRYRALPNWVFEAPVPDFPNRVMEVTKLMVKIEKTDLDQYYSHPFCGLVYDPENLYPQVPVTPSGDKRRVWVVHCQGAGSEEIVSNFVIHSIPTVEELTVLVDALV